MKVPDNFQHICEEELIRGTLISYPRKLEFMQKRKMKDMHEVNEWMAKTRDNFEKMVKELKGGDA